MLIVAFTVVHFKSQTYHSSHDGVYMQHYVFKKSLYSVLRYLCSTFSSVIQYLKYLRTQMMFINSMKKSQEFSFEMPPLSIYQVSIYGLHKVYGILHCNRHKYLDDKVKKLCEVFKVTSDWIKDFNFSCYKSL